MDGQNRQGLKRGGGTALVQEHGGAIGNPGHVRDAQIAAKVKLGRALGMAAETIAQMVSTEERPISRDVILNHYRQEFDNGLIEANMKMGAAIFNSGLGEEVACLSCNQSGKRDGRRCEDCLGKGRIWVREPNPTAQIWWSKNMMGWSDQQRIEHTGPGGGPILTEQVSSAERVKSRLDRIRDRIESTSRKAE